MEFDLCQFHDLYFRNGNSMLAIMQNYEFRKLNYQELN